MTQAKQLDLTGRRALVTGGASGIGRACAQRLAAAGADVVIADLQKVDDCTAFAVDLSDLDALDRILDQVLDQAGRLDIIVNNAGFQHVAPIEDFPADTFSKILRVMVEAPFRILGRVLPGMYERGWGRV